MGFIFRLKKGLKENLAKVVCLFRHESLSAAHNVPHQYSQPHHQQSNNEFNRRTYQSLRNPPSAAAAGLRVLPASAEVPAAAQSAIRTLPPRVLTDRLNQLPQNAGRVEEYAINVFKLLTLLIPPSNRRKLQLLLKFIRKVILVTRYFYSRISYRFYFMFVNVRLSV